ncbi:hypothetical protein LUZ60_000626 [Juncus effusus]|nr:hypothetical protein LUZ60_000626 [Juncus effusus]
MVLPAVKLLSLVLKTFSKPVAARLKQQAGIHPKFRNLIISLAQANHRLTTNLQRQIYGHATNVEIRPLNEEKAVQNAVDLLGEIFVFSVAGGLVIFEVQRSARSEARKEESRRQEIEGIKQNEDDLSKELESLKQRINELELARSQGISGIFKLKQGQAAQANNSAS